MSTELSTTWLPLIDAHVLTEDEIPLLGDNPPFPWDQLKSAFEKTFQWKDVELQATEWKWRDSHDLLEGIGENPKALQIAISPLEGTLTWVMAQQDLNKLMSLTLGSNIEELPESMQEGFYSYFASEVLHMLESTANGRLLKEHALPQELSLCLDMTLKCNESQVFGRLFLSTKLRRSWKVHHEQLGLAKKVASPIPLTLSAWVGSTQLSLKEWTLVACGDFLVLEHCSYQPETLEGAVLLSCKHTLLFHGDLKKNKIIIMETRPSMDKDAKDLPPEDPHSFLGEDEEFFIEDEELSQVLKEEIHEVAEATGTATEAPHEEKQPVPETKLTPDTIPINIKVEIAHLTVTAKELLELRPGNEISLGKEVDNRVHLIVSGRCIGKGELIRIGETLGVRVTQL